MQIVEAMWLGQKSDIPTLTVMKKYILKVENKSYYVIDDIGIKLNGIWSSHPLNPEQSGYWVPCKSPENLFNHDVA